MSDQQKVVALKPVRALEQILNARREALKQWAVGRIDPAALIRWALLEYSKSEHLRQCTPESIYVALIACAQFGLEPSGVRQEAFIVPFKRTALFIPGWRGFVTLARRAQIRLVPHVVFAADEFELDYMADKLVVHKPALRDRGDILGAYAWARLPGDEYDVEWMPIEDLEHVREMANRVRGGKDSPAYADWPDQMYRKAPVRRIAKRLPAGEEFARAAALDVAAEVGDHASYSEILDVPSEDMGEVSPGEPVETRGIEGAKAQLRASTRKQTPASETVPPGSSPASADVGRSRGDPSVEVMELEEMLERCFDAPDSMPHIRARIDRMPESPERARLSATWVKARQEMEGGR